MFSMGTAGSDADVSKGRRVKETKIPTPCSFECHTIWHFQHLVSKSPAYASCPILQLYASPPLEGISGGGPAQTPDVPILVLTSDVDEQFPAPAAVLPKLRLLNPPPVATRLRL